MGKLRIGLIGCGDIAEKKHMEAMKFHSDRCEMVGFSDVNLARAEAMRDKYGIPGAKAYSDYKEMLKDDTIELVHICTPNAYHAENAIAAMEAGKHVMCEKPMAHDLDAAKRMVEVSKKTGKKLSISYQYRFRRDSMFVKEQCSKGELGEIYWSKAQAISRKMVPTWGQFLNKKAQGGGPLIDLGTHALDLTLWMMNEYDVDFVMGKEFHMLKDYPDGNLCGPWKPEKFEVEDSAVGFVVMKSGHVIEIEASWALNILDTHIATATLFGTKAGAELCKGPDANNMFSWRMNKVVNDRMLTIKPDLPGETFAMFSEPNELMCEAPRREFETWFDAIENDTDPVVVPEQALTVSAVLDAVYKSSATGKPVYF